MSRGLNSPSQLNGLHSLLKGEVLLTDAGYEATPEYHAAILVACKVRLASGIDGL
jgi:hypothetical protein